MKALVVGGGIAGLSATIALRRADVEIDVVEVNPKRDVYGVGIIQPGNALRALDRLGLGQACLKQGFAMEGGRFHSADRGIVVDDAVYPSIAGPAYPPMNGITRPRLHKLVQDAALGSGAEIRLGVTVSGLLQDADGVEVSFSDGTAKRYDLVVGADGINSLVRTLIFGDEVRPETRRGRRTS
jgi:2-polyprenyl-6-methoxyphenol hydroxylase-like FAD-dependent oxidoreductase